MGDWTKEYCSMRIYESDNQHWRYCNRPVKWLYKPASNVIGLCGIHARFLKGSPNLTPAPNAPSQAYTDTSPEGHGGQRLEELDAQDA